MRKIRVVFDKNVLISAWLWMRNESKLIEYVERGVIEGYTSLGILDELRRALRYPKFKLTEDEIEAIYNYYLFTLRIVESKSRINAIKEDPEDNKVLECVIDANADYIASGDKHLLNLRNFRNMKIVKAGELLKEIEKGFEDRGKSTNLLNINITR